MTFTQSGLRQMGCENPGLFYVHGPACVRDCMVTLWVLFILSLALSSKPPPPLQQPHVHKRARHVLSAVRRWGYCWLGDHYKGHKRAIYRSPSEWSQHARSSHPAAPLRAGSPAKSPGSEASTERAGLRTKLRTIG